MNSPSRNIGALARLLASLPGALFAQQHARAQADFQDLGVLPGGYSSVAYGVSGDGLLVVGASVVSDGWVSFRAFAWTRADGMWEIGASPTPGEPYESYARAASADGRMVAGKRGESLASCSPMRYEVEDGVLTNLPLSSGSLTYDVYALSHNGAVAVGYRSNLLKARAVRWVAPYALDLPGLSSELPALCAYGVSGDGITVVGVCGSSAESHAVRWVGAGPAQRLIPAPDPRSSSANAVSTDGQVIVGESWTVADSYRPFRWSPGSGVTDLGLPDGQTSCRALATSADGSVVVGSCQGSDAAFYWSVSTGMRPLFQMLVDAGAPVSGWRLSAATGVSADGSVIVGWGHRPDGEERAWRAVLAPCVADFNRDGGIDGADVESFFVTWEAGDPRADVSQDGGVDGLDIQVFFERWSAGC